MIKNIKSAADENIKSANSTFEMLQQGFAFHKSGNFEKAKAIYEEILIIDPENFDTLQLSGTIETQEKNWPTALDFYNRALAINSTSAVVFCNHGIVLKALQRINEALSSYEKAIELKHDYAEAYYNQGVALNEINRFKESLASYDKAIQFKFDYFEAYYNRGIVAQRLKRLDDAIVSYDKAIEYKHDYFEAYCNRGIALHELHQIKEALASINKAIELKSDYTQAHYNRGKVLNGNKQIEEALASYDKAIEFNFDFAEAHHNKSLSLLLLGKFEEGFREYEWRWKTQNFTSKKIRSKKPEWTTGARQRVLVWAEQGVGDEVMFGTLLQDFKAHCTELIVEADERLLPLYQRSMPEGITFVPRQSVVPEHAYDSQISMASLCQYLRNDEAHFLQARKAYLKNDPQRCHRIRDELQLQAGRLVCGISWHSQNTDIGASKSIALKELIRHLDLPECQWVNLQYGDMNAEIAKVNAELGVEILQCPSVDNRQDMDGLASLIDACDVIVSISNTTVHLAGALGKEVHVMLPFCADWRWLHNRSDSIWYPHVHLHRQPTPGDWDSVFAQVRDALLIKQESLK